jgi:hypothetical protein
MLCEPLKYLRCYVMSLRATVIRRRVQCEPVPYAFCHTYLDMAFNEGWEAQQTAFPVCSYEPGEAHADSLLMSLRRAPCYVRNCGVDNRNWRKAMRRERQFP